MGSGVIQDRFANKMERMQHKMERMRGRMERRGFRLRRFGPPSSGNRAFDEITHETSALEEEQTEFRISSIRLRHARQGRVRPVHGAASDPPTPPPADGQPQA